MPVGELAVGMSPLSRRAMQIALSAPPSTGHLSAAHVMMPDGEVLDGLAGRPNQARTVRERRASSCGARAADAGVAASRDSASAPTVTAVTTPRILRFRRMSISSVIGTRRHVPAGEGEGGRVAVPGTVAPAPPIRRPPTERAFGWRLRRRPPADPPVLAVLAGEESPVDQVAAERRVVVEEAPDDGVHLLLVVADARLELDRDPLQHDPALAPPSPGSRSAVRRGRTCGGRPPRRRSRRRAPGRRRAAARPARRPIGASRRRAGTCGGRAPAGRRRSS